MITRFTVLFIALAQLVACDSRGAGGAALPAAQTDWVPTIIGGNDPSHFEGIWQGTITPDDTNTTSGAILIVNGWGEFRLLSEGLQFVGAPRRTKTELSGELVGFRSSDTAWKDGSRVSAFEITGTIGDNEFIHAAYSGEADSGLLALSRVTDSSSSSISSLQGSWVMADDNENTVASFQMQTMNSLEASVYGSHANGCTYSGVAESWTSAVSYDIWELLVKGCSGTGGIAPNGTYSGSAVIIDIEDDGRAATALVVGLSNDQNQLTFILYRP